ncbi:TetR/AcrR family transcriptional regulator C-terminal domain-containing protein [Paractinoplanes toevensis]|uniref:TetR family transcriptional regulator n=1 Tax=Paractinoplanes toevensis TaxID=571911 RepID=A0A919W7T5_9ACTN|nr:TetR/AcrR family transcriptional regulator C-terminal domain-containing protein [Actinoplanes toevensis]GIM90291.1 TetR family transcriptional regulator [Actinoplanes toevensis]
MAELFFDSVWLRPPSRKRTGQPTLDRDQIVRAAMELLDADGPAGLSMRRLGTRLGAGATSLYWHVANKDDLLELAIDEVLGEIYVPEPGDTGWRIALSVMANGMRSAILRHPWVIGLLGTKPTLGPNAMRMGERSVALLTAAGFTGMEVSHVSAMIHAHALGSATTEAAVATATKRAGRTFAEMADELEPILERLSADNPRYDTWRKENVVIAEPEKMWHDSFVFGLERLLDGLEAWLAAGKPA